MYNQNLIPSHNEHGTILEHMQSSFGSQHCKNLHADGPKQSKQKGFEWFYQWQATELKEMDTSIYVPPRPVKFKFSYVPLGSTVSYKNSLILLSWRVIQFIRERWYCINQTILEGHFSSTRLQM